MKFNLLSTKKSFLLISFSSHSPIFSLLFVFLIALVDLVVGANSSSIYIHSTWWQMDSRNVLKHPEYHYCNHSHLKHLLHMLSTKHTYSRASKTVLHKFINFNCVIADVMPNEPRTQRSPFCRSSAGSESTESKSGCSVTLCPVSALDW